MGVSGPDVYYEETSDGVGLWVYRASALGGCTKRLIHARVGDERLETRDMTGERVAKVHAAMDAGTDLEASILGLFEREHGEYAQEFRTGDIRVQLPLFGNVVVRGHCDALMMLPPRSHKEGVRPSVEQYVVEAKSCGGDEYERWKKSYQETKDPWLTGFFPRYKWQMSVYLLAVDAIGGYLCVRNRDAGEQMNVYVSRINNGMYGKGEIIKRVMGVETAAKTMAIPVDCDVKEFPCPYFPMHSDSREEIEDVVEEAKESKAATVEKLGIVLMGKPGESMEAPSKRERIRALAQEYSGALKVEKEAGERKQAAYKALQRELELGEWSLGEYNLTKYRMAKGWDDEKVEELAKRTGVEVEELRATGVRVTEQKTSRGDVE